MPSLNSGDVEIVLIEGKKSFGDWPKGAEFRLWL
jgi:hypothetical protein